MDPQYNRINRQLPRVYRKNETFEAMGASISNELDSVNKTLHTYFNNLFTGSSDEQGVIKWEHLLGIIPETTNLDTRIFNIQTALSGQSTFTLYTLNNILTEMVGADGYDIDIDYNNYKISLLVALTQADKLSAVRRLLFLNIPANMVIEVDLKYNLWGKDIFDEGKTWTYLQNITWTTIKEGVIN